MKIEDKDFVQYLTIKKRLAPKTVDTYRIRFRVVNRWLAENNLELTKHTLETYLFELKQKSLGNAALNTYIQTLRHLEGYCKDRDLPTGFMEGIESMPKSHPEIVILSVDEINRLVSTELEYKNRNGVNCGDLDKKYRALTNFLALTGCRFEEAASLRVKRLDIQNGRATLVNTKNKDNRYIYFHGPMKAELEYLINGKRLEDLVFTNSKSQHIKAGDFNNDLRLRAKKAGILKRVHAHLLRHSYATHLLVAGVDISMVATLLGHRDVQTTYETYVHLADETLKKASMRSPLVREYIEPHEIIKTLKDTLKNFHFEDDSRFEFATTENNNEYQFRLQLR